MYVHIVLQLPLLFNYNTKRGLYSSGKLTIIVHRRSNRKLAFGNLKILWFHYFEKYTRVTIIIALLIGNENFNLFDFYCVLFITHNHCVVYVFILWSRFVKEIHIILSGTLRSHSQHEHNILNRHAFLFWVFFSFDTLREKLLWLVSRPAGSLC